MSYSQLSLLTVLCIAQSWLQSGWTLALDNEVDFQRDIQPIFAEHCAQCHSVDAGTRQAELRLDVREDALRGGASGRPAIVPGDPESSELVRRIMSGDPDVVMPPPDHQRPLTADQRGTLSRWIQQGAPYAAHWSFQAPVKPLPRSSDAVHPIDAWVREKLAAKNLTPAPRAADAIICRRLYLDLIGIPPTPAELDAFREKGLLITVQQLLQSTHYGEKWARHWLDVARYSDSNGYEKDNRRDQWAYRDWVVQALNQDLPYDQFVIEQIAGDLLPQARQDQWIATGFLRNSMINEEGAIVAEQFRRVEMFDRIDCIGKAVLGISTQCAQCHTHKFDPITQSEYYGIFACLNNCFEARSWVYSPQQLAEIDRIHQAVESIEQRLQAQTADWRSRIAAWESDLHAKAPRWGYLTATELGSDSGLVHPTQEEDKSLLMLGHPSAEFFMISAADLRGATGLQLELLTHGDLPFRGPGREVNSGTCDLSELEVFTKKPDGSEWDRLKLVNASADFSAPEKKSEDGKKTTGPVALAIDGNADTSWSPDRGRGRRNQPAVAVVQFEQPLDVPPDTQIKIRFVMNGENTIGCCRLGITRAPTPNTPAVAYQAQLALAVPQSERNDQHHRTIFAAWRESQPEFSAATAEITSLWEQYPTAETSVLHLLERPLGQMRVTHLLERGEWDQPRQTIAPHAPAFLPSMIEQDVPDRLRFARWLVDPRSPLAARVAVNRVWQAMFGAGLVDSPEDFGTRSPVPEHRELLDWLAVDFMEHGWSQKHLIETIVTSQTYQQSSHVPSAVRDADPTNRWLARGPRFRADAEVVRDIALSISGLLTHKMGGAPIFPPVPQNVLDLNFTYPRYWKPSEGPERYRRSLYIFRKRCMPDPGLTTMDAPNGDLACARRVRSNTPLAALTGLNEPVFVEAARALGLRIVREGGETDVQRAHYAFRLCTLREPVPAESAAIVQLIQSRRQRIAEGWLNVRDIVTGDPRQLPDLPATVTPQDAAAWTLAARVLLNLDETLSKN